jgi:hypothetical protein
MNITIGSGESPEKRNKRKKKEAAIQALPALMLQLENGWAGQGTSQKVDLLRIILLALYDKLNEDN